MLGVMWLSLLPWGFVLLGLLPLWLFPRQASLYPGLVFLLAALMLAAAASLYARVPLGPQARFFWVLGLGLMSSAMAVAASRDLAQIPEDLAVVASVASLMGACAFLMGLFFLLRREVPSLPPATQMGFRHEGGVLSHTALQALAPSLGPSRRCALLRFCCCTPVPTSQGLNWCSTCVSPTWCFSLALASF